jgi:hypothetical protein
MTLTLIWPWIWLWFWFGYDLHRDIWLWLWLWYDLVLDFDITLIVTLIWFRMWLWFDFDCDSICNYLNCNFVMTLIMKCDLIVTLMWLDMEWPWLWFWYDLKCWLCWYFIVQDWWNSTSFANYYRTWNIVVHDWLYTYVYKDASRVMKHLRLYWRTACIYLSNTYVLITQFILI